MICAEKGVAHRLEKIQLGSDEHRPLHPFAKMPIFDHGDVLHYLFPKGDDGEIDRDAARPQVEHHLGVLERVPHVRRHLEAVAARPAGPYLAPRD